MECKWYSFNLDDGKNGVWMSKAVFPDCVGLEISKDHEKMKLIIDSTSLDTYFLLGEALFLKGMIYIFVNPNKDSIIALSLEDHLMGQQELKIHKSQLSNVTTLKAVIPFYS